MYRVCPSCGGHDPDAPIEGAAFVCRACGAADAFRPTPLYLVLGASGSGKSTTCEAVRGSVEVVALDADLFWRADFDTHHDGYRAFRRHTMTVCFHVAQNGRPVALFGAGQPWHYEQVPERACFSDLRYLALVCDDDHLEARLLARPGWAENQLVEPHVDYNRWLKDNADTEGITLVDTSAKDLGAVAVAVRSWLQSA